MPKLSLPKPRIFISHSAHEPEAENVRLALVKCLNRNFDVKTDKELLTGGQDFRENIFNWINQAHGAVILFSSSALTSPWVKTEASILAWRRVLDKTASFQLVPVLLSPVTRADIEAKEFSPMRLATLQLVRSDDPVKICKDVRAGLQPLLKPALPETPFEGLIRQVAWLLKKVTAAELLSAAYAMSINVSNWTNEEEYPTLLAKEMLEHGLPKAVKGIRELDNFLDADATETLIELIAPVWVSLAAASRIPQIASMQDTTLRKLWVNGGDDEYAEFTAGHFVRRACCRPPQTCWPVLLVPPDSGEDDAGHYKRVIKESLKIRLVRNESASEVVLREVLARKERDKEPIFIAFTPPGPDRDVIAALRDEFPTLTFFILTGYQAQAVPSPDMQFLQPELKAEDELAAYAEYINAISYRKDSRRV